MSEAAGISRETERTIDRAGRLPAPVLCILLVAAWLGAAPPAGAVPYRWSQIGPPGGQITVLATNPRGEVLYAGAGECFSSPCGIYRSTDGGASWTRLLAGHRESERFLDLAVGAGPRPTLYAASFTGLSRSQDGGAQWRNVLDLASKVAISSGSRPLVAALVSSPSPGSASFALYTSTDQGASWTQRLAPGGFGTTYLSDVEIHPDHPERIYVGGLSSLDPALATVWRTTDGGLSWKASVFGESFSTWDVAVAGGDSGVLYTAGNGVLRSRDGGATWEELIGPQELSFVTAIKVAPDDPRTVYIAAGRSLLVSHDTGTSWERVDAGLPRSVIKDLAVGSRGRLMVSREETGIWTSDDGGGSWREVRGEGLPPLRTGLVRPDPRQASTLYVAEPLGQRLQRSTDDGRTWTPLAPLPIGRLDGILDLAIDPGAPQRFFVSTFNAIYRSSDGGRRWSKVRSEGASGIAVVEGAALLSGQSREIQRSADGGRTWHVVHHLGCAQVCDVRFLQDPRAPRTVYAHAIERDPSQRVEFLLRSTDGGRTWRQTASAAGLGYLRVAVAPGHTRTLYLVKGTEDDLFEESRRILLRSDDGGRSWTERGRIPAELVSNYNGVQDLAVDARDPETVYVATERTILRSTDGGASFERVEAGMTEAAGFSKVQTHPRVPGLVYALSFNNILHRARFAEP